MFEQFRGQNADNLLTKNDIQNRQLLVYEVIGVFKSTPKYRNIEPLGGLQKGCEIHR